MDISFLPSVSAGFPSPADYVELILPLVVPSPHNIRYLAIFTVIQIPNNV